MTSIFTSSVSCVNKTGTLYLQNNTNSIIQVDVLNLGLSLSAAPGNTETLAGITIGTHTLEINTNCTPLTSSVNVNSVIQTGNGLLTFITTTSVGTLDISVTVSCV
jgi:hypothetical protein